MMGLTIRNTVAPDEYPQLVSIWRSAVDATHDFLAPIHRDAIQERLSTDFFPQVDLLVAECEGILAGFAGVSGSELEMLFVGAGQRGAGIGTALLRHVVAECGVVTVDVNEQNEQAVLFYGKCGFTVDGRSDLDKEGRPYPLLHLRLDGTLG